MRRTDIPEAGLPTPRGNRHTGNRGLGNGAPRLQIPIAVAAQREAIAAALAEGCTLSEFVRRAVRHRVAMISGTE